jgi:hypothetical protein
MTIFEKVCDGNISGSEVPTKRIVQDSIAGVNSVSEVPEDVRVELLSKLK